MRRRRSISVAIALGCGWLALAWGLLHLHGIFVEERNDAAGAIAARRRALEQYAQQDLGQRLRERLAAARPSIDAAVDDPLIGARALMLFDRGQQLLPRLGATPAAGTEATTLFQHLVGGRAERYAAAGETDDPGSPWTLRLRLLCDLERALAVRDRALVEQAVRQILAARALFVIAATHDIPFTLAMLALLRREAPVDPALGRALLREGLRAESGSSEGLQRALLRHRYRFSREDFAFLEARVRSLSTELGVPHDDFAERASEPPVALRHPPAALVAPALLEEGRWYVEPAGGGKIYGAVVDVPALLGEITASMHARALLGPRDRLSSAVRGAELPLDRLVVAVQSPDWAPAIAAVHGRYRLKAALEVAIAVLVAGVMALGYLTYRRRHRFLALKGDFVSAVSHELRTPLASIRLMAETLERRTRDVPGVRDYPARIVRDIDGLGFLVENILSFNRLSRGKWKPQRESVRLGDVVARLAAERDLWARRAAELTGDDLDRVVLRADRDLLKLLLTNLLRNACSYNERDPARVRLSAVPRPAGGWIVRVGDNGVGIPTAEHERIFDDFYRAREGSERGSGLGLAICRKVMEAHGGSVRVAESSPAGTTFELCFPG